MLKRARTTRLRKIMVCCQANAKYWRCTFRVKTETLHTGHVCYFLHVVLDVIPPHSSVSRTYPQSASTFIFLATQPVFFSSESGQLVRPVSWIYYKSSSSPWQECTACRPHRQADEALDSDHDNKDRQKTCNFVSTLTLLHNGDHLAI